MKRNLLQSFIYMAKEGKNEWKCEIVITFTFFFLSCLKVVKKTPKKSANIDLVVVKSAVEAQLNFYKKFKFLFQLSEVSALRSIWLL